MSKPVVQLTGQNGNVFAIIGAVSKALKKSGDNAAADAFRDRAIESESYDAVLRLCSEYVDVR